MMAPTPARAVLGRLLALGVATAAAHLPTSGALAEPASLRAYQCVENGVATFSDEPCGRGQRRVFVGYSSPQAPPAEPTPAGDDLAESDTFIDRLELKREIARSEGRISDLEKERDAELDRLRARIEAGMTAAPSSGANAQAAPSPSAELQVIETRYAEDIALEQHRLDRLRDDLAAMERASGQR
jgi:hypothetical protein